MSESCYLCGAEVPDGEGSRHDVLDGNGFGRLNALIGPCCEVIDLGNLDHDGDDEDREEAVHRRQEQLNYQTRTTREEPEKYVDFGDGS